MIETYLLEHLVAFHNHKTLSAASRALNLTQPTLTRSMKKLEELFGVPLFDHGKRSLRLNSNGLLAVSLAENILELNEQMVRQVRTHDLNQRTLRIGSVAPGPIMEFAPIWARFYADMAVASEQRPEATLITGLHNHTYQMIILTHPLEDEDVYCQCCLTEQLYVYVADDTPLALKPSVSFEEMDGYNFLVLEGIGSWDPIVRSHMPNSRFLVQSDELTLATIAQSSSLPSFSTNITLNFFGKQPHRVSVPFSDPESSMRFYAICLKENYELLKKWFQSI